MRDLNIRCSMIGLAAEVRICRKLCTTTHGTVTQIVECCLKFLCVLDHPRILREISLSGNWEKKI